MEKSNNSISKLYSQSALLSIGTIFVTVALFLFKVVFYQKSQPAFYSEFLLAYSLFLFYSLFGYLNVGNPLSNDVYKNRAVKENGISMYLTNAIFLVIFSTIISSILLSVNLIILQINWQIILLFCLAMFLSNINLVLISFYRGLEKILTSSVLVILKGITKPLVLLLFSFALELTAVNITLAFLVGEIISLIISLVFIFVWIKRNNITYNSYKPDSQMLKRYFFHSIPLVLISFSFQGFRSYLYTIIKFQVSEETLGYLDVAFTFLLLFLAFFNNIGLMLAANSERFGERKSFFKFLFTQVFTITVLITILYEIIAFFVSADDIVLEFIFDLNGGVLARGIMIILPAFPFLVLFYIVSGYKQGKRQYYSITLASILTIIISLLPGYFLIKIFGLDGALISLIIFSVILATLVVAFTYKANFEEKLDITIKKLIERRRKKVEPITDEITEPINEKPVEI